MTAKKLIEKDFDYVAYVEDRLGSVTEHPSLWLSQVQRSSAQGLVAPEFLLHLLTNIEMFHRAQKTRGIRALKRFMDLIAAVAILPFTLVLFAIIAIAIKLDSKGPVFFKQTRIGFLGVPFKIWKFRTMYEGSAHFLHQVKSDSTGAFFKSDNDPRTTRVGRLLRRWSLDETPQILNILSGDMSLVGPRPLPVYDVAAIPYQMLSRFSVAPGLTGLWQVTARDSNDGQRNLFLDQAYAEQISLKLDLWIIAKTPLVVLRGTGAR